MALFLFLVIIVLAVLLARARLQLRNKDGNGLTSVHPGIAVGFECDNGQSGYGSESAPSAQGYSQGDRDAHEYISIIGDDYRLTVVLEIDYRDGAGGETTRQIEVKRFRVSDDKTNALIGAFCLLRQSNRDFYASRIQRCVDTGTGEVVQDIPAYLMKRYEDSALGQLDKLWDNLADELMVLVYVARMDGILKQKKKEVIADFALLSAPLLVLTQPEVVGFLKDVERVSRTKFGRLLTLLSAKDIAYKEKIVDCADRILQTKKSLRPDEGIVIAEMRKKLFPKKPRVKNSINVTANAVPTPPSPLPPPPPPPPPPPRAMPPSNESI
jgi:hypothetical protein